MAHDRRPGNHPAAVRSSRLARLLLLAACTLLVTSCDRPSKPASAPKSADRFDVAITPWSMVAGAPEHHTSIKGRAGLAEWIKSTGANSDTLRLVFAAEVTFGQWYEAASVIAREGMNAFRFAIRMKGDPADLPDRSFYRFAFPFQEEGNPLHAAAEKITLAPSGALETVVVGETTHCIAKVHATTRKREPEYIAGENPGPWKDVEAKIKNRSSEKPGTKTLIFLTADAFESLNLLQPILESCIESGWDLQISISDEDTPRISELLPGDEPPKKGKD